MALDEVLSTRSGNQCEMCAVSGELSAVLVDGGPLEGSDASIAVCPTCVEQLAGATPDMHHWRCLNESMWSQVPPVQVSAWRMLKRLSAERWAQDLFDMIYLDEDTLKWASTGDSASGENGVVHKDSNGAVLAGGDTVTLIKDLNVKGAGFTAKRGTAVRNISLVPDNEAHIEGRVSGQLIVILTEFVKKST